MFAPILWRMEGSPAADGMYTDFSDVAQGIYYETAIGWAAKNGISGGYGEGKCGPNDPSWWPFCTASPISHSNVAISHAAKKLVRLIYALDKSRQPYRLAA